METASKASERRCGAGKYGCRATPWARTSNGNKQTKLLTETVVQQIMAAGPHLGVGKAYVVMSGKVGSSIQPGSCAVRLCIRPMQQHQLHPPANTNLVTAVRVSRSVRIIRRLAETAVP